MAPRGSGAAVAGDGAECGWERSRDRKNGSRAGARDRPADAAWDASAASAARRSPDQDGWRLGGRSSPLTTREASETACADTKDVGQPSWTDDTTPKWGITTWHMASQQKPGITPWSSTTPCCATWEVVATSCRCSGVCGPLETAWQGEEAGMVTAPATSHVATSIIARAILLSARMGRPVTITADSSKVTTWEGQGVASKKRAVAFRCNPDT